VLGGKLVNRTASAALLSAGWLIASRLAVSVKWRSWARVTKY
jgi:hypothetical protein